MKKWLFNIFVLPLIYFISILPFWVLYRLSDVFFVLVYVIIGYRKKVVTENLKNSFPEKSEAEISAIRFNFYRHFCDVIFETLKVLTVSKKGFEKHCYFTENATRIFHSYEHEKLGFICVLGHCGNWEWTSIAHQIYFKVPITGIYHPLSNQQADALVLKLRSRFGGILVPMKNTLRAIAEQKKNKIVANLGLIADQTPPPEGAYWTIFLNQETAVFYGTEKIAKRFNYPVVFISMEKKSRGHYAIDATVIANNPVDFEDGQISEMHTKALEERIRLQPEIWLWSHRRWKHKKPA